jgi:hypothetical protein
MLLVDRLDGEGDRHRDRGRALRGGTVSLQLRATFVLNRVLVVVRQGEELEAAAKLVRSFGQVARDGADWAYVCEKGVTS